MSDRSRDGFTYPDTWATRAPLGPDQPPTAGQPADVTDTVLSPNQSSPSRQAARSPDHIPHVPGYEVLGELGRGGMGVVYKARQRGLNRLVALKMVLAGDHASRDEIDRFRAEAEVLARLHHPHIIQIYEIDEHEGRPYFSMEYVDGGSLADRLDGQPLSPPQAAGLVEMLARAVHAAHEAGIVHRDLKPANILLAACGLAVDAKPQAAIPKITDFGLAKRLEEGKGKTRSGDILGTPNYMAPEQAAGRISQIGPATDVHALGAILYECLTGRPPFGKETLLDTLEQVRSQEPVSPRRASPAVPRDLDVVCLKCLRKHPDERYRSAGELADELRRFLDSEPIRARPASLHVRALKWSKRHPLLAGFMVLLLSSFLGGLLWLSRSPAVHGDEAIQRAASLTRRGLFERVYQARTPEGWHRNDLSRDDNLESEPWSHAQAVCAMLRCPEATPQECRELLRGLELLRTQPERITRDGKQYGWAGRSGAGYTQAEPILWAASALTAALARPGLVSGKKRTQLEEFLAETHTILRTYAPTEGEGGWHIVAHAVKPGLQNTYVNILALQTLLDTRQAGLTWDGSAERRDALIAQTTRWLLRNHQGNTTPPGWYKDNGSHDKIIDGLTLQGYAVLLRAANRTGLELPDSFTDQVRRHLLECGQRSIDAPDESAYVSYAYRPFDGKEDHVRQHLKYLWYPWAIESSVQWLDHARRKGQNETQWLAVKRVLGWLVVDLGPQAVNAGEAFIYIPTERLYALTAVGRENQP